MPFSYQGCSRSQLLEQMKPDSYQDISLLVDIPAHN